MSEPSEKQESAGEPKVKPAEKKKQPNVFQKLWKKSGLNFYIIMLMMKGGLPPIIALAAYESRAYAEIYTTLGYLVAIMSVLSMCIQPRAKFVQSMFFNVVFVCLGAALALLQIQCVVAARSPVRTSGTHQGGSGSAETPTYDSSACTVSAVFLFLYVFLTNYVRSKRPQLMIPCIMVSIFTVVASIYSPSFPNMTAGMSFVRRLLISFMTGFAIATGVSLFVFPTTSRQTISMQTNRLIGVTKATIAAHGEYMSAIMLDPHEATTSNQRGHKEAAKLRGLVEGLGQLFGKIKLELGFARKEIAWGKLAPDDYSDIFVHFRTILIPIIGLSTFMEIVQSVQEGSKKSPLVDNERHKEAIRRLQTEEWHELVGMSHDAYLELRAALNGGLDHILYQLGFAKMPKRPQKDVEEKASSTPSAGEKGFTAYLEAEITKFHTQRDTVLHQWAEQRGVQLPKHFWERGPVALSLKATNTRALKIEMNQQQLYLVLFIEYLTHNVAKAILKMAKMADAKVEDGTMSRNRWIVPGWRKLRKLISDAWSPSDADETMNNEVNGGSNIYIGDAFKQRKDPEHLPPRNVYEKVSDHLRFLPKILESPEAHFAFRAAMAALSIGIIAYLKATRNFFLEQRGLWAIIMTAISMDPRAGQSIFAYLFRFAGTVISMVASIAIWYMCDGYHAAILVIFWLYLCFWMWFLITHPQFAVVAMISMVTNVLILGYEMQVDVIGIQLATSNGQAYYPVYLLAPYRLVAVAAGLGVAFIWTYFPYPITTRTTIRKDLGSTLYLLANWYSCVHTTVEVKLHLGPKVNQLDKSSPVHSLDKARQKVFGKTLLMLNKLREQTGFLKFEPPVGGKFPTEIYNDLINSTRNIFSYLALMAHSANAFTGDPDDPDDIDEESNVWLKNFREFAASTKVTSHQITSTLSLLSASITNSSPLPPYLQVPRPYNFDEKMQELDPEILSIEHVSHPCYAAFAVIEVASALVSSEMNRMVSKVKELVGEVDFSFHVISTSDDGSSNSSTLWEGLQPADSSGSGNGSGNGNGKAKDD